MAIQLLKHGRAIDDAWTRLEPGAAVPPDGAVIVPLETWLAQRGACEQRRAHPTGVWLAGDAPIEALAADVGDLALIALRLPKFADGRAFSAGLLLRQRFGFRGELRAFGNLLPDQVRELHACGFDAFEIDATRAEAALRSLGDFAEAYQASCAHAEPLFRRRQGA